MEQDKFDFLQLVIKKLHDNPEWLSDLLVAIMRGLNNRIKDEQDRAHVFDTAMTVLLMSKAGEKVAKQQKPIIDKALDITSYRNK